MVRRDEYDEDDEDNNDRVPLFLVLGLAVVAALVPLAAHFFHKGKEN